MHLEFMPSDAPDPDAPVSVPPEQITTELLELCEEFLRQASPVVHTELRQFLTEHGHHGGLGWFLDALSFTTLNHSMASTISTTRGRAPRTAPATYGRDAGATGSYTVSSHVR